MTAAVIRTSPPLPVFSHCPPQLFTDGTTNKLVGCYVDDSPEDVVLVRVYGNKTELIVDRDNELKSFQVAYPCPCPLVEPRIAIGLVSKCSG